MTNARNYDDRTLDYLAKLDLTADSRGVVWDAEGQLVELTLYNPEIVEANISTLPRLRKLDVSRCVHLKKLHCVDNDLEELRFDGCAELEEIECHMNRLTRLDLSCLPSLGLIRCYNNRLTELIVSGCRALDGLFCEDNRLTALDLSNCPSLTYLNCAGNPITELDVSRCPALYSLHFGKTLIAKLDVSGFSHLRFLYGADNPRLAELKVSNCPNLDVVYCLNAPIKAIDVSGCPKLYALDCDPNVVRIWGERDKKEANQEYQVSQVGAASSTNISVRSGESEQTGEPGAIVAEPRLDLTKKPGRLSEFRNFETID